MKKENKTKRILELYRKLMTGQSIRKRTEADYYGVDERTIQRDIAEIRTFIENDRSEKSNGDFLAYDYREHRYHLEEGTSTRFKDGEILAVCKILLDSRAFPKKNMEEIIDKLLRNCVHPGNSKMIAELIDNEKFHYIEPQHKKDFLEMMWEIGSAIRRNLVIEVNYRRAKDDKVVQRRLQPVAILFSEFYFYLTAFIDGIDKEKHFENVEDPYPTIYRIDRIENIKILQEHFRIPYKDRFQEGEFRKKVQFMYGGKLTKIKFKYKGHSTDAVLDRLPTATILSEKEGEYMMKAEVFGKGIDIWLRSQGDLVEIIDREE